MKYYVYHLKDLKKSYRRHINGTYRFLNRNSKIRGSRKVFGLNICFCHYFSILIHECCYFWSEIDMFRLNVFYITFWGIHEFSYKWYWKCTFSGVMDVRAIIHKVCKVGFSTSSIWNTMYTIWRISKSHIEDI